MDGRNINAFAAEIGIRGLNVILHKGKVSDRTVVDVGISETAIDLTINARTVFAGLPHFRGRGISVEQAAHWLDEELKAQLFWVTVSQKWRDVREKGISAVGSAVRSSTRALLFLYDDRRLITARR